MYNILKLNEISPVADKAFPANYSTAKDCQNPAGIMLRSFNMHGYALPESVLAVARAGAGTNNIPIDKYTPKGIVVFNTPGANANAVKELTLCGLFLASRHVAEGIEWTAGLKGKGAEVAKLVETGKNNFVGPELLGKKLGIVGLGAIGAQVANAAVDLGMTVYGYDPFISIDAAWSVSNSVVKETDLNNLCKECDYISLHIPLNDKTKNLIDGEAIAKMKPGAAILNFSRGELVSSKDVLKALAADKLGRYVTDFPADELIGAKGVICIPHLGASTPEAEDNCAYMAAKQLVDYIENGNITNSVNFPNCSLARTGKCRITVMHLNIKSMLVQMTDAISGAKINIPNMLSKSQGEYSYAMFELDDDANAEVIGKLNAIKDILRIRVIR
ncbi:MAG: 3-phosphoglycerate dehydrogenase [Clostridiales bacterium]|jgi:D-3-phosphoglycerate dehydrogenase|nr:3-phosphoglycerate dehydrogenase [Clostridiales bacterium]